MSDRGHSGTIWQRHLEWGLVFGTTAGVVESVWAHLHGFNVSTLMTVGIIAFDLIVIVTIFLCAGAIAMAAGRWARERSIPLALGLYTLWSLGLFIVTYLRQHRTLSSPMSLPLYLGLLVTSILVVLIYARFQTRLPASRLAVAMGLLTIVLEVGIAIFSAMLSMTFWFCDPWENRALHSILLSLIAAFAGWFFLPGLRRARSGAGLFVASGLIAFLVMLLPLKAWERWTHGPIEVDFDSAPSKTATMPNVILMVLDTVRADRLTLYGAQRNTSPNLERFASESIVFDRAVSSSSFSLPSHATLFTGLYPVQHQCNVVYREDESLPRGRISVPFPLANEHQTIAERLGRAGYCCGGITANSIYVTRKFGFEQGFHYYDDQHGEWLWFKPRMARAARSLRHLIESFHSLESTSRDAGVIVDESIAWLEQRPADRPYFLFLNFMEAHEPYVAPASYRGIYSYTRSTDWAPLDDSCSETERRMFSHFRDRYDEEITYLDNELGRLFAFLESRPDWEQTVVIITSDHGESLGEYGLRGHEKSLYSAELWIPLLLRYPGGPAGMRDDRLVELTDILPTVNQLCGFEPDPELPGESLIEAPKDDEIAVCVLRGRMRDDDRSVQWGPWAFYAGGKKLLKDLEGSTQLFDYSNSMHDVEDVSAHLTLESDQLDEWLAQWIAEYKSDDRSFLDSEVIDKEALELLKAMGYLQ